MDRKRSDLVLSIGLIVAMAAFCADAEQQNRQRRRDGDGEFRKSIQAQREEHFKQQMMENREFHESIKGEKDPQSILSAFKAHRETQHDENMQFAEKLYDAAVAQAKERFAENDVPADKQKEVLDRINEHYQEKIEKREASYDALMQEVDKLSAKEDLTPKQVHGALKSFMQHHGRKGPDGDRQRRPRRNIQS